MGATIGATNIRIGADIQQLLAAMRKGSEAVRAATLDINSRLVNSYKAAAKEQAVFRGGLAKLGDELQSIGGKMALFGTLPALFAVGQAYKDYADLQKLEKGLNRYGESMETVRDIAKLPNIGIFDAAKSLISLKAMKLNSDLAARSIKAFANAITDAGGSAIDLEPALINLRQFTATKHINQVDLRQLAARMPQTYDALEAAFGTQDVEKLNEKMAKIGVQAFIDKFVTELEKIPKAGGGAATAMEQLADSSTILSAEFGKGADNAFGITEKISGLTKVLDSVAAQFRSLTPEAQKSLFALGTMAIVIPAVVTAAGTLIKLWPVLTTGFTLLATSVGAPVSAIVGIAAAVAIAAAAIITHWDSIKKFLTDSTLWNTFKGLAQAALGIVIETFKVVINLIQGDWENFGKAIVNVLKNIWNFAVNSIGGMLKSVTGAFAAAALGIFAIFDKDISKSDWYRGVNSAISGIDGLVEKVKFDVPDSFGTAGKAFQKAKDLLSGVGGGAKEAGKEVKALSDAAKQVKIIEGLGQWWKDQNSLKQAIKGYKELVGVTANLNVERLQLKPLEINGVKSQLGDTVYEGLDRAKEKTAALIADRITATQEAIRKATEKAKFGESTRDFAANSLKEAFGSTLNRDQLKGYFEGFQQIGKETDDQYKDRIDSIEKSTGRLKSVFRSSFSLDGMKSIFGAIPEITGKTGEDVSQRIETVTDATSRLKEAFGSDFTLSDAKEFFGSLPKLASKSAEKYDEQVQRIVDTSIQLSADLTNALRNAANEIAIGFGEMIGNLMTGAGGVEDFAKRVVGTLGTLLKDMGKSLIAAGTAGIALKLFAKNPYLALAAGIGLVALGTATTNKINNQVGKATTRFAKGGFAYEEMTAIVGDNPNSRNDPEMIAPYSKVHDSIKKSIKESSAGGGQVFIADVTVRGEDLRLAFKRANENNIALTGKKKWG